MSAKVIQVIHEQVTEGVGTTDDPCRVVHRFYEFDGTLIAERDPIKPLTALGYRGLPNGVSQNPADDYNSDPAFITQSLPNGVRRKL